MHSKFSWILACLVVSLAAGCSSTPKPPQTPPWTTQPTRTVDGGYIVFVGVGEDRAQDRSQFKAEGMAIQDLANECSFTPKGTQIEDHFTSSVGVVYRSYAKLAITFEDCEAAKAAVQPAQIQTLASAPMTAELKRYQDLVDTPEDEELASNQGVNPAIYQTNAPIQSQGQFFVVRQQVAFMKEDVILVPQNYPPGAPQTQTFVNQVQPAQSSVASYVSAHPAIRTGTQSFSANRPNAFAHQPSSLRDAPAVTNRQRQSQYGSRGNRQQGRQQGQTKNGKGKRRRRPRGEHN